MPDLRSDAPTLGSLAADVSRLGRQVDGMEDDRRADSDLLARIARHVGVTVGAGDDDGPGPGESDKPVVCTCGTKVGYYDAERDEVRARHREHLVVVQLGVGGSMSVSCRKCSRFVAITYQPPDGAALAEVRDGLIVFGVRELATMLQQAMEGTGQVTLRIAPAPPAAPPRTGGPIPAPR